MTSDYGNFHLQIKFQMKFLRSQTQVLAHLAIRRSAALTPGHTNTPTVAIQLVDPCNQPRSSLSSTISPAFQSLNFNVFSDFTWWRYYILWCFSELDGTKRKRILVTWSVALFSWDVMQKHDIHMCYSKLHGIHMIHINLTSIHSTHRLPVSDCISEVRPPTARRLTRSNERPTHVALEPRRELRWIQPLARLQALIPREMTTTLVLVTPQKNGNRLCQSSSNMRKPAIQPQKKCIHWFICIHHHSSVIEATLNHSTVVASIHLTSSIPEMPAAHQETWCKSQPVKYHTKVETLRRFPIFSHFSLGCLGEFAFSNVMMTAEEHSKSGHHHGPGS